MQGSELKERVFAPGNLVHGRDYYELFDDGGIKPGSWLVANGSRRNEYRWQICTALLPRRDNDFNYNIACHSGPKRESARGSIAGVVLSRERVLSLLPGKVFAIDDLFVAPGRVPWTRMPAELDAMYKFSKDRSTVFDIPVKDSAGETRWDDEVRIYATGRNDFLLTPDLWEGIVITEASLSIIRKLGVGKGFPEVPVFNTQGELIANSLS